ncbi:MAG: hypothetical protein KAR16_01115 [Bacteroidales bacterium]|nr:hypothetical protein [Bacteroidales bacterium]
MEYINKSAIGVVFAFCCLLLMVSWTAFGQDPEPLPEPGEYPGMGTIGEISSEIHELKTELNMSDLNRITIQQMGDMNKAFIRQVSGDNPNLVKVHQDGFGNLSDLTQSGKNNATDITQNKFFNTYTGTHTGDNITNKVIQDGYGNMIHQDLNASFLDFEIMQSGIGHKLFQMETRDDIGYKVIQEGSVGMEIHISQGNIYK